MSELILEHVSKSYKKTLAVDGFTYTFQNGTYGLLGPNGAGKSTLMNMITRNIRPDSGTICFNGENILDKKSDYLTRVGYMPQQQSVYDNLTLLRFLYYIASLKGMKKSEAKEQIESLLKEVDLWDVRKQFLGSFSGGMKQRALIAQAMLGNPDILILDEPTAGLDPLQRIAVRQMIAARAKDRIVLVSTHVLSDIEPIADDILMLKKGRILKESFWEAKQEGEPLEEMYVRVFG